MKKGLIIFLIVIGVIVLIVLIGALTFNKQYKDFLVELDTQYDNIEQIDLKQIPDGEYRAKFGNIPVMFDLKVLVKDHQINDIVVLEKSSGPGYDAPETLDRIIKAQKCKIDAVTGATISSKTIMVATYLALTSQTSK